MMPKMPVIWKGIGSVIQRNKQNSSMPNATLPVKVRVADSMVRILSGIGIKATNRKITTASAKFIYFWPTVFSFFESIFD